MRKFQRGINLTRKLTVLFLAIPWRYIKLVIGFVCIIYQLVLYFASIPSHRIFTSYIGYNFPTKAML